MNKTGQEENIFNLGKCGKLSEQLCSALSQPLLWGGIAL
jgi:hypothetical protein